MVKESKIPNVNPLEPLRQALRDTIGKLREALLDPKEVVSPAQSKLQVDNFLLRLDKLRLDLKSGKYKSTKHLNEASLELLGDYIRRIFKHETETLDVKDPDLIINFFNILFPEEKREAE